MSIPIDKQPTESETPEVSASSYAPCESLGEEYRLHINKKAISLWLERWFLSSNAKDIGVLYLIFALISGLIGTAYSVLIRLELSGPGVQFIEDNQLYNSIITSHAIVMIFFMVKKLYMSNKSEPANTESASANTELANTELSSANSDLNIGNDNNGPEDNKPFKHKYTKVFIKDPYHNRDTISRLTKKQKGVYV